MSALVHFVVQGPHKNVEVCRNIPDHCLSIGFGSSCQPLNSLYCSCTTKNSKDFGVKGLSAFSNSAAAAKVSDSLEYIEIWK